MFFFCNFQRRNGYINQGRRRANDRARRTEREDSIRRTVYVSELDHTVSSWWLPEHALLYIIYSQVFVRSNDVDHLVGDGGKTCWYLRYLRASKLFHLFFSRKRRKLFHLKILICTCTCVLQIWNFTALLLVLINKSYQAESIKSSYLMFCVFSSILNVTSLVIKDSPLKKMLPQTFTTENLSAANFQIRDS